MSHASSRLNIYAKSCPRARSSDNVSVICDTRSHKCATQDRYHPVLHSVSHTSDVFSALQCWRSLARITACHGFPGWRKERIPRHSDTLLSSRLRKSRGKQGKIVKKAAQRRDQASCKPLDLHCAGPLGINRARNEESRHVNINIKRRTREQFGLARVKTRRERAAVQTRLSPLEEREAIIRKLFKL